MGNGIGFEHYFINYYMYLPFSKYQEDINNLESLKYMIDLNLIELDKKNRCFCNLDFFLTELKEVINNMENFTKLETSEIMNAMKKVNELKIIQIKGEIKKFFHTFQNFYDAKMICEYSSMVNDVQKEEKNNCFSNNNFNNIIYGDYLDKNENIEIYLHQRTMKKVKYKRREYFDIHQMDTYDIEKLRKSLCDLYFNPSQKSKNFNF